MVREAAKRRLGMRRFDGTHHTIMICHSGFLVAMCFMTGPFLEMKTGEGKATRRLMVVVEKDEVIRHASSLAVNVRLSIAFNAAPVDTPMASFPFLNLHHFGARDWGWQLAGDCGLQVQVN